MAQLGVAWADDAQWPTGEPNSGDPWWPRLQEESPFDDAATKVGPVAGGTGFSVKSFQTRAHSPLYDPDDHTGHKFRVRANCTVQVGSNWKYRFQLWQGPAGGMSSTLIHDTGGGLIAMTQGWHTYVMNVSEAEAGNITDYTDLSVEVGFNQFSSGDGGEVYVSAIEIELPDAAPTDGALADRFRLDEEFGGSVVVGSGMTDSFELDEGVGAMNAPARLVDQGRRFTVRRVLIDMTRRRVPTTSEGR